MWAPWEISINQRMWKEYSTSCSIVCSDWFLMEGTTNMRVTAVEGQISEGSHRAQLE